MHPVIEIHAPLIQSPVMVYDSKDHLINASHALRAGISCHESHAPFTYAIWFDDGVRRHHMARVFDTREDAQSFLESIYHIKE